MNDPRTILVKKGTHKEAVLGRKIQSFRGEKFRLKGKRPPHKSSSSGFVYVTEHSCEDNSSAMEMEYYPGVFGLEFITQEEHILRQGKVPARV